ncbi:hypothetical protein CVT26_004196 [Gymnopilus dilepis]|uniref:Uncharacterized protein n=1 Tax=Gymnopilus dilepis TaxID=231916 RepID=A0A409YMF3_9AGAR|nr:hypothetical protein CVT26_004196 [Gymnopilus dilepis]
MPTKALPPVTEPVSITVAPGIVVTTTINALTGQHIIECDLCTRKIRLPKTGHPDNFYRHRNHCPLRNKDATAPKELQIKQYQVPINQSASTSGLSTSEYVRQPSQTPQISQIISSLSHLHTESRPQSPTFPLLSVPMIRRPKLRLCPGIDVEWSAGSIWATYAYHQHEGDSLPWTPVGFDSKNNTIRLRDDHCLGELAEHDVSPCHRCQCLPFSREFKNFEARSKEVEDFTPWHYLTFSQMVDLLKQMSGQLRTLRTELHNARRRNKSSATQISDYKRILMLIASNEVAGLRRLIAASLKRGCSPKSIIVLLERAIRGLYSPHGGFSERDFDLGLISQALGGTKLLHALHHALGLPSESTLRRHHRIPRLLASIAVPSKEEIDHNISAFFDPRVKPFPPKFPNGIPGNVAAFDGIAIESKCRYCPQRRMIMGLCREHCKNIDPTVQNLESIEDIRAALFDETLDEKQKVCFGSDATVVAIAPYARDDHYTPVPVIVSPSDKSEKGPELAKWIRTFIDAWRDHEYGERVSGPIWALASDGDATFRKARQIVCLEKMIEPSSGLGKRLVGLQGLNLYTSREGITGTCDPKHIFKRFATLMRNTMGIIIYGTNITPYHIIKELSKLPDLSLESARELLDPADKQNVPKAVALVQHLSALKKLPAPKDAVVSHRRHILNFLAVLFSSFVNPFIDVELSLTEQVKSLSTFAHLAAALYIKHGTVCMTGALYADCQSVIKNLVFVIAQAQEIDPNIKIHIIHEGSDRLERLFGDCRTQDHGRNFDLLRPNGTYVGSKPEEGDDRSEQDDGDSLDRHIAEALASDTTSTMQSVRIADSVLQTPDSDLQTRDSVAHTISNGPSTEASSSSEEESIANDTYTDAAFQDLPTDMSIEDFMPDTLDDIEKGKPAPNLSHTLTIDGKPVLIDPIVSSLSPKHWKRVTMRTLRAQGRVIEDFSKSKFKDFFDVEDVDDRSLMKAMDLVALLVRSGDEICIAVMEVTAFRFQDGKEKSIRTVAKYTDLSSSTSIRVIGQLVQLSASQSSSDIEGVPTAWEWPRQYIQLDVKAESKLLARSQFSLEVPSALIHPINPRIIMSSNVESPNERLRWTVHTDDLQGILDDAWESLRPDSNDILSNLELLPIIVNPEALPYKDNDGKPWFFVKNLPSHLLPVPKLPGKTKVHCFICGAERALKEMRNHVGRHILWEMRNQTDSNELGNSVGVFPCGFCGLDGCSTQPSQRKKGQGFTIRSNCIYHYEKMNYKSATQSTKSMPCTNVPIHCPLCPLSISGEPRTIWKYSAIMHLLTEHPEPVQDLPGTYKLPLIPPEMLINMFISRMEEERLGIQEKVTRAYREENELPGSDDIAVMIADTESLHSASTAKRGRAETLSVVEPEGKRRR